MICIQVLSILITNNLRELQNLEIEYTKISCGKKTNNGDFLHHVRKNITKHWLNDRCFAFYSLIRFWRLQWPMPVKGRSHTLTWCWQSANFRSSIKDQIDVNLNDPKYTSARYKTHKGFTSFFFRTNTQVL